MADEICTPEEVNINAENTNTEQLAPRIKKKEQWTPCQSKTKVSDPTHAPCLPIDLPKTPILPLPGTNACLKSRLYPGGPLSCNIPTLLSQTKVLLTRPDAFSGAGKHESKKDPSKEVKKNISIIPLLSKNI